MRDGNNLFDLLIDEDYYGPIKTNMLLIAINLNMKVEEIKTKLYQSNNILIRSNHV